VLPTGQTLNLGDPTGRRVFTPGEAYEADTVLKDVLTIPGATGTAAYYGCPAAGKTGTTSSFTDAYFDGYTPQLATAVWVGYPNETQSMPNGFGGTLAAPIWHDYMARASNGYCGDFPPPALPWHGTPFFGKFAGTAKGNYNYGTGSGGYQGAGTGTTGATQTNPYTNTTLFSSPPQGPPQGGVGGGTGGGTATTGPTKTTSGGGPPPGYGNGHNPGSGGAGIK
jgi:penicillin-binding protein 1A